MPNTYLVVLFRIEKLTELIADLRQPPIVEGSDGSVDVRQCSFHLVSEFVGDSLIKPCDIMFNISLIS